jgi:RHS repeat-associated protein
LTSHRRATPALAIVSAPTRQGGYETPASAWRHAAAAALLGFVLTAPSAASSASAPGTPEDSGTCDPSRATCVTPCRPVDAALGRCKPGAPADPGPGGPGPGGTCTPAPGGDPGCGGDGPASRGGAGGGVAVGGGNPINLLTGNKYQEETDLAPLPGVLGLELKRHYNSLVPHAGLAGAHWRIGYETVLYDVGSQLQIVQADGRRLMFQRGIGAHAALCSGTSFEDGQVRIEAAGPGQPTPVYHWRWPDGRTLTFAGGSGGGHPLQSITAASGQRLTLHYGPDGALWRVRDPQGRELRFVYAPGGQRLQAVDTPLGQIRYTHDALGRLVEATRGDVTRVYHHEDAHNGGHANALTGISVRGRDPQAGPSTELRIATWHYNTAGQAVLSVRGRPRETRDGQAVPDTGIEQIELQFAAPALPVEGRFDPRTGEVVPRQLGRTVVTNSLGQTTEVLHAVIGGHHRLVEMRGPGCAGCGPSFMRYGWDASGRLRRATRLDVDGRAVLSELVDRDPHGRIVRTGRQRPGAPAEWLQRAEYDDRRHADGSIALAAGPARIEAPSIVAGQRHTLHITYDARGRPVSWTERGASPVDERGRLVADGRPIERTTTWRFADIAGSSVLVEIDGPLPNGPSNSPADSDITRLQWDEAGRRVAAITQPLERRTVLTHDDASGRLVATRTEGDAGRRWRHGADGRLIATENMVHDHVVDGLSLRRDLLGRIVEVSSLAGGVPAPLLRQTYDTAGRLQWQADRRGVLREARYDTEGHLLTSRVRTASMQQEERYRYDTWGRLAHAEDDTGAVHRLEHDAAGRVVAGVDALGRITQYAYDDDARLAEATLAAGTPQALWIGRAGSGGAARELRVRTGVASQRLLERHWIDDFGREVMTESPDAGRTLRRYDPAGRVTQLQTDDGTTIDLEHDVAGRIVARTVTPRAASGGIPQQDAVPQTTRYRYEGDRLVAVLHPHHEEHFEHDAAGRLAARTVRLVPWGTGAPIASTTHYRRDTQGRLVGTTLPDGSELQLERDGLGQIVALRRHPAEGSPFGWGDEVVVSKLRRDLVGLRELTYGNGLVGAWDRSREGVLARVAVTPPGQRASPDARALWETGLLFDVAGNVVLQSQRAGSVTPQRQHTRYLYDTHDQLTQALRVPAGAMPVAWRYHHDALGQRLLMQEGEPPGSLVHTAALGHDDSSRRDLRITPDAEGRVAALALPGGGVASYRYDHRGLRIGKQVGGRTTHTLYDTDRRRIADLDDRGRIKREYIWLADQLVAVIDFDEPRVPHAPPRNVAERIGRTIAAAWRLVAGRGERVSYVHANHLGAPVLMTDAHAQPVWTADYAPFGRRLATPSRLDRVRLDLRLPGQWEDDESGLHYNDQRYYDPDRGRYLTPDPLGLRGGLNAYAYAGNNPVRYSDPLGLLLFAFDGTGNDEHDPLRLSNVVSFRDLYQDTSYYITGPGTLDPRTGIHNPWYEGGNPADIVRSLTGKERIARLILDLNRAADDTPDDNKVLEIDVIGFSRGAAEARDFASQVTEATRGGYYRYDSAGHMRCQRLDFRFMGLWDTVLSVHAGQYDLAIPDDFAVVAQAVALNEYRGLFPLESIRGGPAAPEGTVRIERGFLGAHSDIGGSFADGDLAKVALSWMVDQARQAGVALEDKASLHTIIANPVLHDSSSNLFRQGGPVPAPTTEDRVIRTLDGTARRERQATVPGMSYADTQAFIRYDADPHGTVAGTVDMKGYLAWLDAHGYGLHMAVK